MFLKNIFLFVITICFFIVPSFNCFVLNIFNVVIYALYDIFQYFKNRTYKSFQKFGIFIFVGLFGHGKTLSMTHYARSLYSKYGNDLLFVSNYELYGIPYVPLVNFSQLLEIGEDKPKYYSDYEIQSHSLPDWYYTETGHIKKEFVEIVPCREISDSDDNVTLVPLTDSEEDSLFIEKFPDLVVKQKFVRRWGYKGTVVLIDEIQNLLNNREFAKFPLQLLGILTQQRKRKCFILASCQRFFTVDKIFRSLTSYVVDCNKFWRFESMRFYDAWDYEHSSGLLSAMKPSHVQWWFVKNKDYNSYSTEQMISKDMIESFLSNEESLQRIGLDNTIQLQAIRHKSRKLLRAGHGRRR